MDSRHLVDNSMPQRLQAVCGHKAGAVAAEEVGRLRQVCMRQRELNSRPHLLHVTASLVTAGVPIIVVGSRGGGGCD